MFLRQSLLDDWHEISLLLSGFYVRNKEILLNKVVVTKLNLHGCTIETRSMEA